MLGWPPEESWSCLPNEAAEPHCALRRLTKTRTRVYLFDNVNPCWTDAQIRKGRERPDNRHGKWCARFKRRWRTKPGPLSDKDVLTDEEMIRRVGSQSEARIASCFEAAFCVGRSVHRRFREAASCLRIESGLWPIVVCLIDRGRHILALAGLS